MNTTTNAMAVVLSLFQIECALERCEVTELVEELACRDAAGDLWDSLAKCWKAEG